MVRMLSHNFGLKNGDTVGSVLSRHNGVGPGFGWLRIILACLIFYAHANYIAGSPVHPVAVASPFIGPVADTAPARVTAATELAKEGGWTGWRRPIAVALVPSFFALSGFLVTGSALRLRRTSTFLAARALRIFPALTTEVTLSALVLGPWLTALPLTAYFSSPMFNAYFGNIFGVVRFELPGLFLDNPARAMVNLNLWTLPGEFYCYLAMAGCMLLGAVYRKWIFTGALILLTLVLAPLNLFTDFAVVPAALPTYALTYYFLIGVALYHWRESIPASPVLLMLSSAIAFMLLTSKHTAFIVPVFVCYSTVMVGMLELPRSRIVESGDYSYGIYLYGFPISQAVMTVAPGLQGHNFMLMAIAGALTCLFAFGSWHLIEKPALKLRRHLPTRFFPTSPRALVPA